MADVFDAKEVPGNTITELKARGTAAGIDWCAKRFPWVVVESASTACGTILSSKYVTDAYGVATRPLQTVTSVSVKKQGELGTTRACTVNFLAYNDIQLNQVQKCFFIPGMTVIVQWGWSISAKGGPPPAPVPVGLSDPAAICQINTKAAGSAIYDGLQGLVTNFNYKLNADNIWECSFELTAAAEGMSESKVGVNNADCSKCERTFSTQVEGEEKEVVSKSNLLGTFFFDVNADAMDKQTSFGNYKDKLESSKHRESTLQISKGNYEGEDRSISGGSTQSMWSFGNYDAHEGYISWATLEAAINRYSQPTSGGKYISGKISSGKIMVKSHPSLTSGDPRICVIPGSPYDDVISFSPGVPSVWGPKELDFSGIMLNCIMLFQELKSVNEGDNKVSTFLSAVLKKVNNACGGFWEDMLEIVSTTEDCNDPKIEPTSAVVDIRNFKKAGVASIPSLDTNSVIREFTLDMKLTSAMKSQALYSNSSKGTTSGKGTKCATVGFVPFGLSDGGSIGVKGKPKPATPPPCDCASTPQAGKSKEKSFGEIFEELKDVVDNGTAQAAIEAVAQKVNTGTDAKETCKGLPMPFEFSFTVDGIGGFTWGQSITSDRIPKVVRDVWVFRITSVEHEITIQDWTTKVSTVAVYA